MTQERHLRLEVTRHREIGKLGGNQPQIECQRLGKLHRTGHRTGMTGKAARHLIGGLEEPFIGCRAEPVVSGQAPPTADGRQHLGEVGVVPVVVVDVVGGHHRETQPTGNLRHQIVAGIIFGHAVVPQLDVEARPKEVAQPGGRSNRSIEIATLRG